MSPSEATPIISEATTSGITIIVIARMKPVPTKFRSGSTDPSSSRERLREPVRLTAAPTTAPRTRPMVIFV
jgi:hypothetical protein